jgi:alkylated DNA repair dioxygenase AlkB
MSVLVQESLLDVGDEPVLGPLGASVRRTALGHGAWVDLRPGWLTGSGVVFGRLLQEVPWRAEKRHMYDKVVAVPRLLCFYGEDAPLPDPVLTAVRQALNAHYGPELGEPFRTAGLCLYRDGRDSVAWHGDTIGRGKTEDTMVAIVSLGTPRPLMLRPRGGGTSLRFEVGHGDLLVMGGSCQRTWEHAVPKTSQPVGPRISVQFRPRGVR